MALFRCRTLTERHAWDFMYKQIPGGQCQMPDVLEGQCEGIRGWKYEVNESQLVLWSDLCLNRVDVKSVKTVQQKLLSAHLDTLFHLGNKVHAGVEKTIEVEKRKPDDWSAISGATGPDRFPRTVTFSCCQRRSLQTSLRFVWKGMIVARLKLPFVWSDSLSLHRCWDEGAVKGDVN